MNNQEKIVKIAEAEIKKFAKAWRKLPYVWETEADVHAEIYHKIKAALRRYHRQRNQNDYVKYRYKKEGWQEPEDFSWVYCKPYTKIRGTKYPDIAIFKKKGCSYETRKNEPMLWVCEIKYSTEWSGAGLPIRDVENDIEKLNNLLRRKDTDYACYLILQRTRRKNSHVKIFSTKPKNRIEKILKKLNNKIKPHYYSIQYG